MGEKWSRDGAPVPDQGPFAGSDGEAVETELAAVAWEGGSSMWDRMVAELDGAVFDGGSDLDPPPELTARVEELARVRVRVRRR